jgi:hypothetical protein
MRPALVLISLLPLALAGCASISSKNEPTIYAAGDKATAGTLVYNLADAEKMQQLGDDPANPRTAKDRFYLIKLSISNSGSDEQPIPAMSLVDDAGQTYTESSNGTGVANWLGVVRKVGPAQTESGYLIFDAPVRHYRLRLNDPLDEKEVAIDLPVGFVRDSTKVLQSNTPEAPGEFPRK